MNQRGQHRASTGPIENFLQNRFEVLEIEDTAEDIEDENNVESKVSKN